MHERSLGRELVNVLTHEATVRGLRRVRRARIGVGCRHQVDLTALDLCFQAAAPGSAAEGAELQMEHSPARAYCLDCRRDVVVRRRADACPCCGGFRLQFSASDDLRILACEGD